MRVFISFGYGGGE
jgi:hypothetical protein